MNTYRSITASVIDNGHTTLFWNDFGHGDKFLRLYSFAVNEDSSVAEIVSAHNLPYVRLSVQAHSKMEQVYELLMCVDLIPEDTNSKIFSWGSDNPQV